MITVIYKDNSCFFETILNKQTNKYGRDAYLQEKSI